MKNPRESLKNFLKKITSSSREISDKSRKIHGNVSSEKIVLQWLSRAYLALNLKTVTRMEKARNYITAM